MARQSNSYFPYQYQKSRKFLKRAFKEFGNGSTITEKRLQAVAGIIMQSYNESIQSIPMESRHILDVDGGPNQLLNNEITFLAQYLSYHNTGKNIFVFPAPLLQMFENTDIDKLTTEHIKVPYNSFYIAVNESSYYLKNPKNRINGAFVNYINGDEQSALSFTVVTKLPEGNWVLKRPESYTISLLFEKNDTIEQAIDHYLLSEGEAYNKHQSAVEEMKESEEFNEMIEEAGMERSQIIHADNNSPQRQHRYASIFENTEHFKTFSKVLINAICYISYPKREVKKEFIDNAPERLIKKIEEAKNERKKEKLEKQIQQLGYSHVYICGESLSNDLENTKITRDEKNKTHWRRGHWWNKPYGEGRSQRVLDWRQPMIINKGSVPKGHIYKVKK